MKRVALLLLLATATYGESLTVGAPAPAFSLPNALGGADVVMTPNDGNVKAVVFTSSCAEAQAFEARLIEIANRFGRQGVKVYVIDRAPDAKRAAEQEYPFAYLKDDGSASRAYAPRVTPEAFVIDGTGLLRYRGFIDDTAKARERQTPALTNALGALVNGRDPLEPETTAFGCATDGAVGSRQ